MAQVPLVPEWEEREGAMIAPDKCPHCGAEIEDELGRFYSCGTWVDHPPTQACRERTAHAETRKRIDEKWKLATELVEYASYAEMSGMLFINRKPIREICDKIFEMNRLDAEANGGQR